MTEIQALLLYSIYSGSEGTFRKMYQNSSVPGCFRKLCIISKLSSLSSSFLVESFKIPPETQQLYIFFFKEIIIISLIHRVLLPTVNL